MRVKKNLGRLTLAIGAVMALTLISATPASAFGNKNPSCGGTWYYASSGISANGPWAGSSENAGYDCGTMGVRIKYYAYSSSPLYYTSWTYHASSTEQYKAGGVGANHFNSHNGVTVST